MISFDRWLVRPVDALNENDVLADELENTLNLRMMNDGSFQAKCCCCDNWGELFVGIDEAHPFETFEHYCGGSDRCCP